ncbi:hypothetical protein [Nonomuraea typhae]|uniref:Uncharacterized protein n=1 Tax=Nonomuraea typhae TaxID=2603600 RepID=A0ABW7YL36_9ACTN
MLTIEIRIAAPHRKLPDQDRASRATAISWSSAGSALGAGAVQTPGAQMNNAFGPGVRPDRERVRGGGVHEDAVAGEPPANWLARGMLEVATRRVNEPATLGETSEKPVASAVPYWR